MGMIVTTRRRTLGVPAQLLVDTGIAFLGRAMTAERRRTPIAGRTVSAYRDPAGAGCGASATSRGMSMS